MSITDCSKHRSKIKHSIICPVFSQDHLTPPQKNELTDEITASILEKTWEQLSASEQLEISNGVSDGYVEERTFTDAKDSSVQLFYLPEEYYGQKVYVVTFTSEKRDLLGDIIKIVDKKSGLIIGYNFRL